MKKAFNLSKIAKKIAFNLKKYKEAIGGYNWRGHQFREDWRQRQRVNSFEGINIGDVFETKSGILEIVGIEVDDPSDSNSAVYLILEDENGRQSKPYRLRNNEWADIHPKESI